jgi:cytochrome c peroxidase
MVHRTLAAVLGALWIAAAPEVTAASADPVAPSAEAKEAFRRPADIPYPAQNPYSPAKAQLGKVLFFDPIISGSGTRSCASCHNPGLSWGDGLPRAIGEARTALAFRSPTTLNLAWGTIYGWDGKFPDLESVTFTPSSATPT